MSVIRSTFTTMGQSSPASVAEGTGYYTYNGDQPLKKEAPAEPSPQNAKASAGRAARLAEYARLRLKEKLTKQEAARQIGICISTAHAYEREIQEQQRGDGSQ